MEKVAETGSSLNGGNGKRAVPPQSSGSKETVNDGQHAEGNKSPDYEEAMAASTGGPSVLSRFALQPNTADGLSGVKKRTVIVPVTKPRRNWWWRAHPEYVLTAGILTDDTTSGKDAYLVVPELVLEIGDDVVPTRLHGAITRQAVVFVLPVRLPGPDGRLDSWNASMAEAVQSAEAEPVRTASNRDVGAYDIYTPRVTIEFPPWPDESWEELLSIAFRDRRIESFDHPVLRRLRGEV